MSDSLRPPAALAAEVFLAHAESIYEYLRLQDLVVHRARCLRTARRLGSFQYLDRCEDLLERATCQLVEFHARHASVLAFVDPNA